MAATPIAFFGLKLVPGKVHRMDVSRDFKITNVSYADQPKSGTKTLVKVHYTHVPGFEDEYDEDEDESKPVEDEDEIEEKVYTLCSLNAANKDHATVDLQFCQEELIGFSITGDATVDLVGNYVASPDFYDQEPSDDEIYSDDDDDDIMYGLDSDELDEEDSDDDEDMQDDPERFEELVESPATKPKKAAVAPASDSKKRAAEKPVKETAAKKLKADAAAAASASAASTPTKATETKTDKQAKSPKDVKPKAEAADKKAAQKPASKMTTTKLPSGLVIEEKSPGNGPACKSGQKVGMRYVGKLTNGKIFDQNTSGKPFSFKLGTGEVIKGWDEGVKGMRVGAERRLTCPAKLAYGNQKLPGIPANSTLVFDVKLVEIK